MTAQYTQNYGLELTEFSGRGWHTAMHKNLRVLDALIATAISIANFTGEWLMSTLYSVGDKAVDPDTGTIFTCQVHHTSSATGTFAEYRAANPTHWLAFAIEAYNRGAWTNDESYAINDYVVSGYQYAVCTEAHTSGDSFAADSAKWEVLIDLTDAIAEATQSAVDAEMYAQQAAASAGSTVGFLQGFAVKSSDVSLSYSTENGFLINVDASAGNRVITLPAASSSAGFRCTVKKTDGSANYVRVLVAGADAMDGGTYYQLASQYDSVTVVRGSSSQFSVIGTYETIIPVSRGGTGRATAGAQSLINIGMSTYAANTVAQATSGAQLQLALGYPVYGNSLANATDSSNARALLGLSNPAVMELQAIRTSFGTTYALTTVATTAQTFSLVKTNIPSGVTFIDIFGVAAGGGASAGDTTIPSRGLGGGGGEFGEILRFPVSSLGDTTTIIIPGYAAGGATNGATGQNGGTLSFGTHMVLGGGTGGAAPVSGAQVGAQGGTVSHFGQSGVRAVSGQDGAYKWDNTAGAWVGGDAGGPFGKAGRRTVGLDGGGYGAGGGGGNHSGSVTGGTGQPGYLAIIGAL